MTIDFSENSVLVARQALQQQSALVLNRKQPSSLVLMLLDRSGSMEQFGDTPRLAANECLQTLQAQPGVENAMGAIFTFAGGISLNVEPQPVKGIKPLTGYSAGGGTKLYEAVYGALYLATEYQTAAEVAGVDVSVAISVITDGDDTASGPGIHDKLLRLAETARDKNYMLQCLGIGVDSERLSKLLGFQPGYARTVASTAQGVRDAAKESSVLFSRSILFTVTPSGDAKAR